LELVQVVWTCSIRRVLVTDLGTVNPTACARIEINSDPIALHLPHDECFSSLGPAQDAKPPLHFGNGRNHPNAVASI
jgi:hypothetical protein